MDTHISLAEVLLLYVTASLVTETCNKPSEAPQNAKPVPAAAKISKVTMNETGSMVFDYPGTGSLQ